MNYTDIPNWLFSRNKLSAQEKWAYVCLLSYAKQAAEPNSQVTISNVQLSTLTGVGRYSGVALLEGLATEGLIRFTGHEGLHHELYWMIDLLPQEDGSEVGL